MKQKKKTLVCVGALLLLLIAGICYLTMDENTQTEEESFWLCDRGVEKVVSLSIQNSEEGREFVFTKGEESFEGNDGSIYKYDQLASYVAALGYMKAEKKVHTSDFQASKYSVSLTYEDGESFCYHLGGHIDGVGMYVLPDGQEDVYLVDVPRAEAMEEMITSLYNVGFTNVNLGQIRGIRLYTPQNGLITINRSEAPRANEDFYWNMFEPYVRTADTDAVKTVIDTMKEIGYLKRTDRKMEPSECGLEKEEGQLPYITLYDANDRELTIFLGDVQGDSIYCRTNDLEDVYLIDQLVLEILKPTAREMADPVLYHYEIPSVKKCTVKWHNEQYELSAQWAGGEGEQRGQRFYLDGEGITGARYRSLTQWFLDTRITDIEEESNRQTQTEGTITIERLSAPYQQEFIFRTVPEDMSLLAVELKGASTVYIEREEVEEFISSLKQ